MHWLKRRFLNREVPLRERTPLRELLEGSQGLARVIPPIGGDTPTDYISLPLKDIPELVTRYVMAVETQETDEWCRCEWIIHPDDLLIVDYRCRECNRSRDDAIHLDHQFRGKRKRRGDQHPECPVHTKEGFLLYFFEWVFTRERN